MRYLGVQGRYLRFLLRGHPLNFRNYVLAAMSAEDLSVLGPHLHEVALESGEKLYEPGDNVEYVHFPSSCVLSVVTCMLDGRNVETNTVGFESCAGLLPALSRSPAFNRAFAQVGGGAVRLRASVMRDHAMQSERFMNLLLQHLDANACQSSQSVACNALHDAPSRLARWLLMTQDRVAGARLPLTQEYLAIMLGLQRTTVTLVAGDLRSAGLIKYKRGEITVVDREGLVAAACECYGVVKARSEALVKRVPVT